MKPLAQDRLPFFILVVLLVPMEQRCLSFSLILGSLKRFVQGADLRKVGMEGFGLDMWDVRQGDWRDLARTRRFVAGARSGGRSQASMDNGML